MAKNPQPSPWGLVIFLIVFILLIWSQSGADDTVEVYVDDVGKLAGTCSIYYSDWPCLEAYGC